MIGLVITKHNNNIAIIIHACMPSKMSLTAWGLSELFWKKLSYHCDINILPSPLLILVRFTNGKYLNDFVSIEASWPMIPSPLTSQYDKVGQAS